MKPEQSEIYQQLVQQSFVQDYIKKFEGVYPFDENSFKIEIWDDFGQCSVWLGFEDQFAIRDAFGNWRDASAEECLMLRDGSLTGTMKLMDR